jgi:hypothetical protein
MTYGLILADHWEQFHDRRDGIRRNLYAHTSAKFLRDHGIDVDVIDFWHDFTVTELEKILLKIKNKNPLFIAICASMDKKYNEWNALRVLINNLLPETKVVIFGERTLRLGYLNADIHIEGYAETALLQVVRYFSNEIDSIKYTLLDGQKLVDANTDYPNDYQSNGFESKFLETDFRNHNEIHSITFSRGCIFKCAFCNHTAIGVRKHLFERTRQSIINDLLHAYHASATTKFMILDSTFNDSEEKTEILLEIAKLIPEKLQIVCFLRPDLLYRQPGLLDKLISAGVVAVHFGIDTLNRETGKIVGKLIDPDVLKQYLKQVRQQYPDLYMFGTFIIGLPADTREHQQQAFDWLNTEKILDTWHWFPLSIKQDNGYREVMSPIEQSYSKFGYTKNYNKIEITNSGRGYKDKNLNLVNWTNDQSSLTDAIALAMELNQQSDFNKKPLNPWVMFNRSVVHRDVKFWLDYYLHTDLSGNMSEMYSKTQQFVNLYKYRKLSYFESK